MSARAMRASRERCERERSECDEGEGERNTSEGQWAALCISLRTACFVELPEL